MTENTIDSIQRFAFPTEILFGAGCRKKIPEVLVARGVEHPLIVTDAGLVKQPVFQEFLDTLKEGGLDPIVCSSVTGNPVHRHVGDGLCAYAAGPCDSILAFGGGAAMDVAKCVALMVNHPGSLFEYEIGANPRRPIDQPMPPLFAVPTTAGTGSEVARSAVISEDESRVKRIITSPGLLPRTVFADPELTFDLPPHITAATGMDALTHCIESFLSPLYHPMCDGIALEGIRLVANNLERAVSHPRDLEARTAMMMAAMMGAVSFQKDLGVVHSCAHALSAEFDLHHGLANGMMLPACMDHNSRSVPDLFVRMSRIIGLKDERPAAFIEWLRHLKSAIGLPKGLAALGVTITDRLIETTMADPCHHTNPVPVDRVHVRVLFERSL